MLRITKILNRLTQSSAEFTKDLLLDPSARDVLDIKHTVAGAASSTSAERAQKFLDKCKCPSSAKAYGSYAELIADPDVDIVYVATPHSHHFQNTMLCLEAGKPVLCEKALTVNASQAKILIETAKAKNLFLMEAVWTRYFPLSIKIRKMIENGEIGAVHRVMADLSFNEPVEETWGTTHRMVNVDLAGGALLDSTASFLPSHIDMTGTVLLMLPVLSRNLLTHMGLPMSLPHSTAGPTENHPR